MVSSALVAGLLFSKLSIPNSAFKWVSDPDGISDRRSPNSPDFAPKPPQSWRKLIRNGSKWHNNNVGLEIGQKLGQGAEDDKIRDACEKALMDGTLIFIKDSKLTKPATYQVRVRYETTYPPSQIIMKPVYETVTTDEAGKPKK